MEASTSPVVKLAWIYAGLFVFVVALGYVPGVEDAEGRMFGLFTIDPIDDAIHLASGIWAGVAAWHSARQAKIYFQTFGAIYFLDGAAGVGLGNGFLDGALFLGAPVVAGIGTRLALNVPHLLIGGSAIFIGVVLAKRWGA